MDNIQQRVTRSMKRVFENAPAFNLVDVRISRKPQWDLMIINRNRRPSRRQTIDSNTMTPKSILKERVDPTVFRSEPRNRVHFPFESTSEIVKPTNARKITHYFPKENHGGSIAVLGQNKNGVSIVSNETQTVNISNSSMASNGQNVDVSSIPSTSRIEASMIVAEIASKTHGEHASNTTAAQNVVVDLPMTPITSSSLNGSNSSMVIDGTVSVGLTKSPITSRIFSQRVVKNLFQTETSMVIGEMTSKHDGENTSITGIHEGGGIAHQMVPSTSKTRNGTTSLNAQNEYDSFMTNLSSGLDEFDISF